MIIERELTPYVVYSGDPVLRALEKITANKARVIFLVDSHGHLDGVLSDGDFRRWVSGATLALSSAFETSVRTERWLGSSTRSMTGGTSKLDVV